MSAVKFGEACGGNMLPVRPARRDQRGSVIRSRAHCCSDQL